MEWIRKTLGMNLSNRWNSTHVKGLTLGLTATLLVACGNNIKPISDAEIQAAGSSAELTSLYQKIQADLAKSPDNKTLQGSLQKVGQALAQRELNRLEHRIANLSNAKGILPQSAEQTLQAELQLLQKWDAASYQQAQQRLHSEGSKRNARIEQLTQLIADTRAAEPALRFETSAAIFNLDGKVEMRAARNQQLLSESLIQADNLYNNAQYQASADLLSVLAKYQPSAELEERISNTRFKASLQALREYQQAGDVDSIYHTVLTLADTNTDPRQRVQLESYAVELMQYYNLMAQTAISEENLQTAYDHLIRTRAISKLVPPEEVDNSTSSEFLSQIYLNARDAYENNQPALAFAYLQIITDFDEVTPEHQTMLQNTEKQLYDRSVIKLAASQFDSPSNAPGLGALITAALVEYFVNADRKDIRILERDSIESVLKEQEIKALSEGGEIKLSSADFLVQGAVLEANVDESSQQTRRTKRVVTELETVSNPEFLRWQQLSEGARAKQPRPLETIEKELKENISFNVTEHRKLGSVTTSFRIINPDNAKLLHAETLSAEQRHSDSSIEGLEIGLFQQPAQTADLPANQKILRTLTQDQATEIAEKLVAQMQNPEERYLAQSQILQAAGNNRSAVTELGKAIMLRKAKAEPTEEQLQLLKSIALQVQ